MEESMIRWQGRTIDLLWDADEVPPIDDPNPCGTRVRVQIPGAQKLFNFEVGQWMVLDPYGLGGYSDLSFRKIFQDESATVAINVKTGEIAKASIWEEEVGGNLVLGVTRFGDRIPREYLGHLHTLMNKKRPVRVEVDPFQVLLMLEHEISWEEIRGGLTFCFDYRDFGGDLEICGDAWRIAPGWETIPEDEEFEIAGVHFRMYHKKEDYWGLEKFGEDGVALDVGVTGPKAWIKNVHAPTEV